MYIYFCGSIRGGRQDVQIYQNIVKKLQTFGKVLTEHVSHNEVTDKGDPDAETVGDKFIHDRDLEWLTMADVIVAEVTQPSLGVGYELGRAVTMKKRILCLFRPSSGRSLSAMIRGAQDGHVIQVMDYDPQQIEDLLDQYFNTLKQSPEGLLK